MRSLRAVTVLVALGLASLGACGDDDDGGAEALTKAEFIDRGDDICRAAAEDGEDLDAPESTTEDLSRYLTEAQELLTDAAADFEALQPPADGEEVQRLYLAALRDTVDLLGDAKAAAEDGDLQTALGIVQDSDPQAEARGPLQTYGFEVCGSA